MAISKCMNFSYVLEAIYHHMGNTSLSLHQGAIWQILAKTQLDVAQHFALLSVQLMID